MTSQGDGETTKSLHHLLAFFGIKYSPHNLNFGSQIMKWIYSCDKMVVTGNKIVATIIF